MTAMLISPAGMHHGIIVPVLNRLSSYNPKIDTDDAHALMLRTAAAESELMWLVEKGGGPSRGYMQIHAPLWVREMRSGRVPTALREMVWEMIPYPHTLDSFRHAMTWNPWAGCAVARIVYWLDRFPIPPWKDAEAQGKYWLRVYNTTLGAGTLAKFIERCEQTEVERYLKETFK